MVGTGVRTRVPLRPSLVALGVVLALTGCAGGGSSASARRPVPRFTGFSPVAPLPAPTVSVYVPRACPTATAAVPRPVWPATLPANLPRPVDATVEGTSVSSAGIAITQFRTPESLISSVGTVLTRLRGAGYTLGRGDGEVAEADVPFADAELRGTIRLVGTAACQTVWIVATTKGGAGDPYLLPHHNRGTATPLPFGSATP